MEGVVHEGKDTAAGVFSVIKEDGAHVGNDAAACGFEKFMPLKDPENGDAAKTGNEFFGLT